MKFWGQFRRVWFSESLFYLLEGYGPMIALCVASPEGQVGKTALCSAIGRRLQNEGKKVGYFKPVTVRPDGASDKETYRDCYFLNEVLELTRPPETLCPVVVSQKELAAVGKGKAEMGKKVQEAY